MVSIGVNEVIMLLKELDLYEDNESDDVNMKEIPQTNHDDSSCAVLTYLKVLY